MIVLTLVIAYARACAALTYLGPGIATSMCDTPSVAGHKHTMGLYTDEGFSYSFWLVRHVPDLPDRLAPLPLLSKDTVQY